MLTNCKVSKQIDGLKKLQDQIQAQINELNDQLPRATAKFICPTCGRYNVWSKPFAEIRRCNSCQQWFKDKVEMYGIMTYPNKWVTITYNT